MKSFCFAVAAFGLSFSCSPAFASSYYDYRNDDERQQQHIERKREWEREDQMRRQQEYSYQMEQERYSQQRQQEQEKRLNDSGLSQPVYP